MDEQLKRRLVGAAVLMLLAVIVVPLFFEDKPPKDPSALPEAMQEHPLALPPADSAGATPNAAEQSMPAPPVSAARSKNRKYEVVPLDDTSAKPAPSEPAPQEPASASTTAAPGESAAYPEEDGEDTAPTPRVVSAPAVPSSKLKPTTQKPAAKLAETQPAKPNSRSTGTETRSRPETAPAATRKSETSPGTKSVKTTTSSTAKKPAPTPKVTDAPVKKSPTPVATSPASPTKKAATSPVTKPKQVTEGKSWTVQAGTFADESNARNLVEKLKKRNLPAKVHAVEGSSGKVYRVTVGSGVERTQAEKIQKELSSKDGVNGVILQNR